MSPQTFRLRAKFPLEPLIHRAAGFFSVEQSKMFLAASEEHHFAAAAAQS